MAMALVAVTTSSAHKRSKARAYCSELPLACSPQYAAFPVAATPLNKPMYTVARLTPVLVDDVILHRLRGIMHWHHLIFYSRSVLDECFAHPPSHIAGLYISNP
jgi:hypothetical protein